MLEPAVARSAKAGIDIVGPFPGDTMFVRAMRGEFDVVIACYHDQGLIPVKLVAFGQAVNVTLGLPIIRTSVDHGTAFDIAGKGIADPESMVQAVLLAARLAGSTAIRMAEKTEREAAQKNIAENRKAFHDYHVLETFEAGVALLGTEVKSIREGRVNLRDSYAQVKDGEVFVHNVHIQPYSHRGYADHEPMRQRKLLLHSHEIRKLIGKTIERGMTLVPLRMYFKNGRVKVALALAKGKQAHDKRETIKKREVDRENARGREGAAGDERSSSPARAANSPAPSSTRTEIRRAGARVLRSELDIADFDAVMARVHADRPDVIINCAAYNQVDAAEDNAEQGAHRERVRRASPGACRR